MKVLCEVSMRHVHLSQQDTELLFGKGAKLEFERALSQPSEFLAKQRVTLVGPKREIENVAVLGPERSKTQVEIAQTDAFVLGIKNVPIRISGDHTDTPGIILQHNSKHKTVKINDGVIIAKRHVHLDPKTAKDNNFENKETVRLVFAGERAAILENAVVRIDKDYIPSVHIDSDEGNAVFAGCEVQVVKCSAKL